MGELKWFLEFEEGIPVVMLVFDLQVSGFNETACRGTLWYKSRAICATGLPLDLGAMNMSLRYTRTWKNNNLDRCVMFCTCPSVRLLNCSACE